VCHASHKRRCRVDPRVCSACAFHASCVQRARAIVDTLLSTYQCCASQRFAVLRVQDGKRSVSCPRTVSGACIQPGAIRGCCSGRRRHSEQQRIKRIIASLLLFVGPQHLSFGSVFSDEFLSVSSRRSSL
jgi:hypothetical protein